MIETCNITQIDCVLIIVNVVRPAVLDPTESIVPQLPILCSWFLINTCNSGEIVSFSAIFSFVIPWFFEEISIYLNEPIYIHDS